MTAAVQSDLKGATGLNRSGTHVRIRSPEPGLDTVGRTAAAVSAMIQAVHIRQQTACIMECKGHTVLRVTSRLQTGQRSYRPLVTLVSDARQAQVGVSTRTAAQLCPAQRSDRVQHLNMTAHLELLQLLGHHLLRTHHRLLTVLRPASAASSTW